MPQQEMTALTAAVSPLDGSPVSPTTTGIMHPCLLRTAHRTYTLHNPHSSHSPLDALTFDLGQVRAIFACDKRLREHASQLTNPSASTPSDTFSTALPAGYIEFARSFNRYYVNGRERFSEVSVVDGRVVVTARGEPVVWERFCVEDESDPRENRAVPESPSIRDERDKSNHPKTRARASTTAGRTSDDAAADTKLTALAHRMNRAIETIDELRRFWMKRGKIELDYATRLASLAAENPTWQNDSEPSELKNAVDAFRVETAKRAMCHHTLSKQLAEALESRCAKFQTTQEKHWRDKFEPAARLINDQNTGSVLSSATSDSGSDMESVAKDWKKDYRNLRKTLDFGRLEVMNEAPELEAAGVNPGSLSGLSVQHQAMRLWETREDAWKKLRSSCAELERRRSEFVTDLLGNFHDAIGEVKKGDDEACRIIQLATDVYRPADIVDDFISKFDPSPERSAPAVNNDNYSESIVNQQLSPRLFARPPVSPVGSRTRTSTYLRGRSASQSVAAPAIPNLKTPMKPPKKIEVTRPASILGTTPLKPVNSLANADDGADSLSSLPRPVSLYNAPISQSISRTLSVGADPRSAFAAPTVTVAPLAPLRGPRHRSVTVGMPGYQIQSDAEAYVATSSSTNGRRHSFMNMR